MHCYACGMTYNLPMVKSLNMQLPSTQKLSMFTTQSKPLVQYIPFTCAHTWYVGRLVLTEPPAANTWQLVRQAQPVFCFSAVQVHMCFDIPRVSKLFCNKTLKSKIFQSVDLFQRCFDIPRVSKLFCNETLKSKIWISFSGEGAQLWGRVWQLRRQEVHAVYPAGRGGGVLGELWQRWWVRGMGGMGGWEGGRGDGWEWWVREWEGW